MRRLGGIEPAPHETAILDFQPQWNATNRARATYWRGSPGRKLAAGDPTAARPLPPSPQQPGRLRGLSSNRVSHGYAMPVGAGGSARGSKRPAPVLLQSRAHWSAGWLQPWKPRRCTRAVTPALSGPGVPPPRPAGACAHDPRRSRAGLCAGARARAGRHGQGVPGAPPRAGPAGGHQGARPGAGPQRGAARALHPGGQHPGPAQAPRHRAGAHRAGGGRAARPGDGVRGGRHARPGDRAARRAARAGCAAHHGREGGARARRGARAAQAQGRGARVARPPMGEPSELPITPTAAVSESQFKEWYQGFAGARGALCRGQRASAPLGSNSPGVPLRAETPLCRNENHRPFTAKGKECKSAPRCDG